MKNQRPRSEYEKEGEGGATKESKTIIPEPKDQRQLFQKQ